MHAGPGAGGEPGEGGRRRAGRRRAGGRAARLLGMVLAVPLGWIVAALLLPFVPGPVAAVPAAGPPRQVALILGGIHTDVAFPLDAALRARMAPLMAPHALAGADWLAVGWGARGFYTAAGTYADIRAGDVLRAAAGDASVLRLEVYGPLDLAHPAVRVVTLPEARRDALLDALLADLRRPDGAPLRHPFAGFSPTDVFYEARGRFDALRTCNAWVGAKLRAAGVPFGLWTPAPQSVALALRAHG